MRNPPGLAAPRIRYANLLKPSGRGVFLINQLMDEVRFERGGTEIHMKKA